MSAIRAAQYLRMSTEHQKYSLEHQATAISAYAAEHGYEIVETYADPGRSGLRLAGREALSRLLADVVGGGAPFKAILVYDVSRWGRFQDPDESAHYEFICRQAGVSVAYCAELFDNDGSVAASIMKHMKRAMAAEYSRELSAKVSHAQRRMAAKGFCQGGMAAYGFRRQVVDKDGRAIATLARGQHKAQREHRIVIVHGPPDELETIKRIFRLFVFAGLSRKAIAELLNAEGIPAPAGGAWLYKSVHRVLTNDLCLGVYIFGRRRRHLGGPVSYASPDEWVRAEGITPPLVRREVFEAAQRAIIGRWRHLTDDQMIDLLRKLLASTGRLSGRIIDKAEGMPCSQTYRDRFGDMQGVYARVGYRQKHDYALRAAGRLRLPDGKFAGRG